LFLTSGPKKDINIGGIVFQIELYEAKHHLSIENAVDHLIPGCRIPPSRIYDLFLTTDTHVYNILKCT